MLACAEVNLEAEAVPAKAMAGEGPAKWGATNLERDSDSLIIQGQGTPETRTNASNMLASDRSGACTGYFVSSPSHKREELDSGFFIISS
jgi:hypothetical protein